MINKNKFRVKINGIGPGELVFAEDHQDAAERFMVRIARRDLNSRTYRPNVVRDGVSDSGANWWRGELWRRARDGNGWVSHDYRATFTTREQVP